MKLKDLILDWLETTIGQFCKEVGIARTTYDNIMQEKHQPSLLTIKKICKFFKVEFRDYL